MMKCCYRYNKLAFIKTILTIHNAQYQGWMSWSDANLIPAYIVKMIERRDQPALDWETHFHFNYS